MASDRIKALQNLKKSLPTANQDLIKSQQAARDIQLQQALPSLPRTQNIGPAAYQQISAQQAQQKGQLGLAAQQQSLGQAQQLEQLGQGYQKLDIKEQAAGLQSQLSDRQQEIRKNLGNLGRRVQNQLLDRQLEFRKNQAGQDQLTLRQMLDYARLNAENDNEFQNYAQTVQLAQRRKLAMLEVSKAKLEQALKQGSIKNKQELDQQTRKRIAEARKSVEKQIQETRNKGNMVSSLISGAVSVGTALLL